MAKLYFKYGSMNSGKSLEIIRVAYNYIERGQNVLLLSSKIDNRYGINKIKSRIGVEMDCISISDTDDILNIFKNENKIKKIDCVLCDEIQFFKKEQINQISEIVDKHDTPVICYGLRSSSKLTAFEGSMQLMLICDRIEEIKTMCHCGKKAIINAKIKDNKITLGGEEIDVGGNEKYISLCRKCFKEGKIS